jgi:hypothetical protein
MWHITYRGEMRNAFRALVGKYEGKRTLGRCRRRWEHNIDKGLKQMGEGVDWIHLAILLFHKRRENFWAY